MKSESSGGGARTCLCPNASGDLPNRVKVCRREVIKELEQPEESKRQQATIDLEDLFMVIQLFSYPGDYVAAKPSLERMAEITCRRIPNRWTPRSAADLQPARSRRLI